MKWFYNMKISAKLILGFITVVLIVLAMGIVGFVSLKSVSKSDAQLYNNMTVPIQQMAEISTEFQRMRVNIRDMILTSNQEEIADYSNKIQERRANIDKLSTEFEKLILSKEMETEFSKFVESRANFKTQLDKTIELAKQNKDADAIALISEKGDSGIASRAEQDAIDNILKMKIGDAGEKATANTKQANTSSLIMIILLAVGTLVSVFLGIFISRAISNPIKRSLEMIKEMSKGHLGMRLNMDAKDEVGQMAKEMDMFAEKLQGTFVDTVKKIAIGDVSSEVQIIDEKDEISPAVKTTIGTIRGLTDDIGKLISAAQDGKLQERADPNKYSGSWKELIIATNSLIDTFVKPINVTSEYIKRISKGDIPQKISDTYYGDFNEIKNSLNLLIESLNRFISDMEYMSKQHDAGDIDIVVPEGEFEGAYRVMAKGVNDMVKGHISVKKKAMACIGEFAKGNFEAELEKFPGKKVFINEVIEAMRKNLKDVNKEINKLIEASEEGRLSERGNDKAFMGDWAELIKGLNGLIGKIVEPVMEAAAVLDEMSKGNLKVRVSGNYKGDHAKIKDALNFTISTIAAYIEEISKTLTDMADGNLNVSMHQNYLGDFIEIKDSLNNIIQALNEVLGEINNAAEQVAAGSKQVSDSSQALSQGSTEQASSIEELTASMTQIADQTKKNAINANQANDLATTAKNNAVQGNEQMKEMLKSMHDINESSGNISKIIKVIDDIAFQTNILALNAAVEAARAGQHGKGFAVVAEEVRNLAARSANAAKETTSLIEGSVRKVEDGTKIANNTAGALNEIVDRVSKAANLVADIATASNEQATGISQVNVGINQVSQVTQSNSATAEESAAASEELSGQAELLKEMVSKFKLKKAGGFMGSHEDNMNHGRIETLVETKKVASKAGKSKSESSQKVKINLNDNEFGKY